MTKSQMALLDAAQATAQTLETHGDTLATPALQAMQAELNTRLQAIAVLEHQQAAPTDGKTVNRHKLFAEAAAMTRIVARLALRFARQHDLPEAIDHLGVRVHDLTQRSTFRRLLVMHQVQTKVAAMDLRALAPFGVTRAMLDDLQARIEAAAARPSAHSEIEGRCVATQRLVVELAALRELLTHGLDPLMELVRETHPAEFLAYRQARMIIAPARASRVARVSATAETSQPDAATSSAALPLATAASAPSAPTPITATVPVPPSAAPAPLPRVIAVQSPAAPSVGSSAALSLAPSTEADTRVFADIPLLTPPALREELPAAA